MDTHRVPNPKAHPPRLLRSSLTGRVFVVTRYTEDAAGRITAITKHDVTADFEALIAPSPSEESGERP